MALNFGVKASKNSVEKQIIAKITGWVKAKVKDALPDGCAQPIVMVAELQCFDPDCVPIETLIVVMGKDSKWSDKILMPSAEVTKEDVEKIEIPNEVLELLSTVPVEISSSSSSSSADSILAAVLPTPPPIAASASATDGKQTAATVVKMKFFSPSSSVVEQSGPILTTANSSAANSSYPSQSSGENRKTQLRSTITSSNCASTVVSMRFTTDVGLTAEVPARAHQHPVSAEAVLAATVGNNNNNSSSSSSSSNVNSSRARNTAKRAAQQAVLISDSSSALGSGSGRGGQRSKHQEGSRPRGCPCCDPDNLDNIIDMMGGMI